MSFVDGFCWLETLLQTGPWLHQVYLPAGPSPVFAAGDSFDSSSGSAPARRAVSPASTSERVLGRCLSSAHPQHCVPDHPRHRQAQLLSPLQLQLRSGPSFSAHVCVYEWLRHGRTPSASVTAQSRARRWSGCRHQTIAGGECLSAFLIIVFVVSGDWAGR